MASNVRNDRKGLGPKALSARDGLENVQSACVGITGEHLQRAGMQVPAPTEGVLCVFGVAGSQGQADWVYRVEKHRVSRNADKHKHADVTIVSGRVRCDPWFFHRP